MESHSDDPRRPSAASLFAAWLARHEAGEETDFESLCREHPAAASELRQLQDVRGRLDAACRQPVQDDWVTEPIQHQYGSDADPHIALEAEEQLRGDFSAEVLSRLAERGPASTRYCIKGEVAHGGMGAVLRVWDEDLRRHLAMKVMLGSGAHAERGDTPPVDPKKLARFLEEAQVTGQLDHPGIVPVHELGLDAEGRVYFTMKLVQGKTLKQVFDELAKSEGDWTRTKVVGLVLKVCEAMSYAHAKGVIHRDLKPSNVMVGKFGEVFVMDWGLARVLGRRDEKDIRLREEPDASSLLHSERAGEPADSPLYTMDGDVVGTPAYMPPEQARGDLSAIGPHSDVYAVGAMLYHLLAGHMPYVPPGLRSNNHAVWRSVQGGPPQSLQEKAPGAPAELTAICDKAMARNAQQRYAEMSELAGDLSAYIEGRVVRAYEAGGWAEARKWVQRNKPLAAALAVAVALLVVGLVSSLVLKAQSDANAQRADTKADEALDNLTLAQQNEQKAKDNLILAQRNEADAQAQRDQALRERARAQAETAKVLRLSDVKVLQELLADEDALWPPHPDRIAALESWLDRARDLADNLPAHRETLAEMRGRSRPWSGEERARDRATHPRASELAEKQDELQDLIAQLEQGLQGEAQETADERVAELEPELVALSEAVESRRTWTFDSPEEQWQHDVLAELVENLEGLLAGLLAHDTIVAGHGWSVPKRLAFAQELEAGFRAGGRLAQAWVVALPRIRESYPGLVLEPQMGLLPIGPDPASGLWEFAHLMTGIPAERGPDGTLVLTEQTGVVLVLLRGGTFWMGAQSGDPNGQNYDPQALEDELPVHEVQVSAFFLSKYELTQGQWLRLTNRNPSHYRVGEWGREWLAGHEPASLLLPVEQVNWKDCMNLLSRALLALPSEAQWEYGARGGTDTPWWTGEDPKSLSGAANLLDGYAKGHGGSAWLGHELWLDDGATAHAPVGKYAANAFGLHDVAGNLWEWCLDGYFGRFYSQSRGENPVALWNATANRMNRGGSFADNTFTARSGNRNNAAPDNTAHNLGVRPARAID